MKRLVTPQTQEQHRKVVAVVDEEVVEEEEEGSRPGGGNEVREEEEEESHVRGSLYLNLTPVAAVNSSSSGSLTQNANKTPSYNQNTMLSFASHFFIFFFSLYFFVTFVVVL